MTYQIRVIGCDDWTVVNLDEVSPEVLDLIRQVNETSEDSCQPRMQVVHRPEGECPACHEPGCTRLVDFLTLEHE